MAKTKPSNSQQKTTSPPRKKSRTAEYKPHKRAYKHKDICCGVYMDPQNRVDRFRHRKKFPNCISARINEEKPKGGRPKNEFSSE